MTPRGLCVACWKNERGFGYRKGLRRAVWFCSRDHQIRFVKEFLMVDWTKEEDAVDDVFALLGWAVGRGAARLA